MRDQPGVVRRLVARIRALLPSDWTGRAGRNFRSTLDDFASFARKHELDIEHLPDDMVELAKKRVIGEAEQKFAQARLDYNKAEREKIATKLEQRTLQSNTDVGA